MKSLVEFDAVKKALEQVVAESDVNNGTQGMEFYCHYWSHENQYDPKRQELMDEMARNVFKSKPDEIIKIRKALEELPKPKIIMEFKLMVPIPMIKGTKTVYVGDNKMSITATNVKSIFIHEDALNSGLGTFEETDDIAQDMQGKGTQIILLKINKGILDVKEAIVDNRDDDKPDNLKRILRPQRVYLTPVSYHALQVVGKMTQREKVAKRRSFGFTKD